MFIIVSASYWCPDSHLGFQFDVTHWYGANSIWDFVFSGVLSAAFAGEV